MNDDIKASMRKFLGPDGKLVISDEMTEEQKRNCEIFNSLGMDLASVLSETAPPLRKISEVSIEENEEDTDFEEEKGIEMLDDSTSVIEENDMFVDDLNNLF